MKIRALIVDDEAAARRGLRLLLSRHGDVEVVGECRTTADVVPAIEKTDPDVVFLDVRMPGGTAIEAFREIPEEAAPLVVLVTAYEEHALEAFGIEAVDYVLKPFTDEAFSRSLDRVRRRLRRDPSGAPDGDPDDASPERGGSRDRIAVRSGRRIHLVDPSQVECVDADGDYVRIRTRGGEYLLRETMRAMQERLGGESFVRIHRSTLVRAEAIVEVRVQESGQLEAVLRDGSRRSISKSGQERLGQLLSIDL